VYRVFFKRENRVITDVKKQIIRQQQINISLHILSFYALKSVVLMVLIRHFGATNLWF